MGFTKTRIHLDLLEEKQGSSTIYDVLSTVDEFLEECGVFVQTSEDVEINQASIKQEEYPDNLSSLLSIIPLLIKTYQLSIVVDPSQYSDFLRNLVSNSVRDIKEAEATLKKNGSLLSELKENESRLSSSRKDIDNQVKTIYSLQSDCETLRKKIDELKNKLQDADSDDWETIKKEKEDELGVLDNKYKEILDEQKDLNDKKDDIEGKIEKCKGDISEANEKIKQLTKDKTDKDYELEKLQKEIIDLELWIEALPTKMEEWARKYNDYKSQLICLQSATNTESMVLEQAATSEMVNSLNNTMQELSAEIQDRLNRYSAIYTKLLEI